MPILQGWVWEMQDNLRERQEGDLAARERSLEEVVGGFRRRLGENDVQANEWSHVRVHLEDARVEDTRVEDWRRKNARDESVDVQAHEHRLEAEQARRRRAVEDVFVATLSPLRRG